MVVIPMYIGSLIICLWYVYKEYLPLRDIAVFDILYFITAFLLPGINTVTACFILTKHMQDIEYALGDLLMKPRWFRHKD